MKNPTINNNENTEQMILDSMIEENPNVSVLINSLDLEIIKPEENEHTTDIQ